ncbi:MAG: FHA domain-containing protein [Streptosporangiaceae bacterium]
MAEPTSGGRPPGTPRDVPHLKIESTGAVVRLRPDVTTIGRGQSVDVRLDHPSVSKLHAEIVRRGTYAYVSDLGLSRYGSRVNGKVVAQRLLEDGDVLSFGLQRCRVGGLAAEQLPESELGRSAMPELTRRELDVVAALCKPALSEEAFVSPATARDIAADLVVTEAAVKQHLLRLYQKLHIPAGPNRRVRLANEVVACGLVRPLPAGALDRRCSALPALPESSDVGGLVVTGTDDHVGAVVPLAG